MKIKIEEIESLILIKSGHKVESALNMNHPVTNETITLTEEQQSCANYVGDKRKDLVIRSVAGGGKSLVLLQRAMNYLNEAKELKRKHSIAVFTYNHVLANYLKEWMQLSEEDDSYIMFGTLHEYLNTVYKKIAGFKLGNPAYPKVKENCLNEALNEYAESMDNDKYKDWGVKFWSNEFAWMRNMNIFNGEDWVTYQNMAREGRGHTHPMDKIDRLAAFDIFCNYQTKLRKKKVYDNNASGDEKILYLTHLKENLPDQFKFDHILIDEAQDQTLANIIAVKKLARADITICMDANQRIYEGHWRFIQAGIEPTSKKLSYPFRCTNQIDMLAESLKKYNLQEMDSEDNVSHVSPTANGEKPEIICCQTEEEEEKYVTLLIQKWMSDDPIHNIGIMCYRKNALEKVGRWLEKAHIEFEIIRNKEGEKYSIRKPGVKLCTYHTSKGLEFMRVILPQFYQGMIPQLWAIKDDELLMRQRSIAYVGMTRAMHQLVIVYNGKKSQFIEEMDSNLYTARTFEEAIEMETEIENFMPQDSSTDSENIKSASFKQNGRKRKWSF